ncbi:PTS sugar transporter subunit IIB, partial [Enterococcus faecium]
LLPAMITISAFALVAAIFAAFGVDDIVGSFYTVVQEPFMGLAFLDKFKKLGESVGKPVVSIPFQAYVPIPTGIQKLAEVIEENI